MEFPATQWTMLALATLNGDGAGRQALAAFHRQYRGPVVEFLRRRGLAPPDAEDTAHGFFVHLMEKAALRRADSTRGRFRSFLLGALVRHLAHEREAKAAAKRGGGTAVVSLEAVSAIGDEPAVPPAEEFERTEAGYNCLSQYVARAITLGVFAKGMRPPAPKPAQ